jgi:hypothetical protein
MDDAAFKKIVSSLSRAIGNELRSYEKQGETYILSIWAPITPELKLLLKTFLKDSIGKKARLRFNSKFGKVTIIFGNKRG